MVYGQNVTRELNIEYLYIHEIKKFKIPHTISTGSQEEKENLSYFFSSFFFTDFLTFKSTKRKLVSCSGRFSVGYAQYLHFGFFV